MCVRILIFYIFFKFIKKQMNTSTRIFILYTKLQYDFLKAPRSKESRELAASTWFNSTCRDIQTAVKRLLRRVPKYFVIVMH